MEFMDTNILQSALDAGQSLIVDVDIGIGATRRAFISAFDTVKNIAAYLYVYVLEEILETVMVVE